MERYKNRSRKYLWWCKFYFLLQNESELERLDFDKLKLIIYGDVEMKFFIWFHLYIERWNGARVQVRGYGGITND